MIVFFPFKIILQYSQKVLYEHIELCQNWIFIITSTVTLKCSIILLVVLFSGKFVTTKFQLGLTIEFSVISKIFDPYGPNGDDEM